MNRSIIFTLGLLLVAVVSYGQKTFMPPDYDAIKKATKDKKSVYYYPSLLDRYKNNDTTLLDDEYKYLYYGYFFNGNSSLASELNGSDTLKALRRKEKLTEAERTYALGIAKGIVQENPFDTKHLYFIYTLHEEAGDEPGGRPYLIKLRKIVKTILASGDGKTDNTGYHVLAVQHEYFILDVLGYEFKSQTLTQHPCDYMEVKSNEDNVEGVYFDITQIFNSYKDMFGDVTLPDAEPKKKKKK